MADLSDMTLEKFKLWSTNALRVFLSLRKKLVTGNFDELAARAFCAWEERISVDIAAEHRERQLLSEYQSKLHVANVQIQDPLTLKSGWLGEKTGMSKWPLVYITDISLFLKSQNSDELMHRLLNEYKEGKAYRYFTGDWVKEVMYHDLGETDTLCAFKAKVTPSQAVNNRAYDVWIVVQKDTSDSPGGEIHQAYCTCTAGMLGSCNHIAGVLFRVEHAVKTGLTKTSSTSKLCVWNTPKPKTTIKPGRATDFLWKKAKYTQPVECEKENIKSEKKKQFTPFNKHVINANDIRKKLYESLKEDVPDSCFALLVEKRRINNEPIQPKLPSTVLEMAECARETGQTFEESKNDLKQKMSMTPEQCELVEKATVGQGDTWMKQRCGRVTASIFHRVYSRTKTLRKKPEEDPSSVVNTIVGSKQSITTKSMKHGLALEPHAKKAYDSYMKTTHSKFQSSPAGINIYSDNPCLAASPDLYVDCKCCGKGLCEIKCPESIKDQIPTADNVPYVSNKDGSLSLKRQHPYFYQIQGQMGITGRTYCDFYIFTCHGHLCFRIPFEKQFFDDFVTELVWFWETFVTKRLLSMSNALKEKN